MPYNYLCFGADFRRRKNESSGLNFGISCISMKIACFFLISVPKMAVATKRGKSGGRNWSTRRTSMARKSCNNAIASGQVPAKTPDPLATGRLFDIKDLRKEQDGRMVVDFDQDDPLARTVTSC